MLSLYNRTPGALQRQIQVVSIQSHDENSSIIRELTLEPISTDITTPLAPPLRQHALSALGLDARECRHNSPDQRHSRDRDFYRPHMEPRPQSRVLGNNILARSELLACSAWFYFRHLADRQWRQVSESTPGCSPAPTKRSAEHHQWRMR